MGMEDFEVPRIATARGISFLRTENFFASAVIRKRIKHMESIMNDKLQSSWYSMFLTILDFWFDPKSKSGKLSQYISRINVVEVNNFSVRLILEFICDNSLALLRSCLYRKISEEKLSKEASMLHMRGRIIRTICNHPIMRELHERLVYEFEYCSRYPSAPLHRMILTYLFPRKKMEGDSITNSKRTGRDYYHWASPLEIHQAMLYLEPNITLLEIKDALMSLYDGSVRQGEFISIRQDRQIYSSKDIVNNASVTAMPRGKIFLRLILIHIDFFGEMLKGGGPVITHQGVQQKKILMEMRPTEGFEYIDRIFNELVHPMSRKFELALLDVYRRDFNERKPADNEVPFKTFVKNRFAIFDELYFYRVAFAHMHTIRVYLLQLLHGNETNQFIAEEERIEIARAADEIKGSWSNDVHKTWEGLSSTPAVTLTDQTLDQLFIFASEENILKKIHAAHNMYQSVRIEYKRLMEGSFEELLA